MSLDILHRSFVMLGARAFNISVFIIIMTANFASLTHRFLISLWQLRFAARHIIYLCLPNFILIYGYKCSNLSLDQQM